MGFSITWFGFENKTKAEALAKFGQRDSGIADDGNEALFSAAQLPTGWTIVFVNDFAVGGEAALLEELSQSGRIVACQIEEHAMISAARGYQDGREKWEVVHDSHRGVYDVSTQGQPPEALADIHRRLAAKQAAEPETGWRADYLFDVPVELAAEETGYRHDRSQFSWGAPRFTAGERKR